MYITAQEIQDIQTEHLKNQIEQLELKIKVEKLKIELSAIEFINKQRAPINQGEQ
jgi:hypothetical protein